MEPSLCAEANKTPKCFGDGDCTWVIDVNVMLQDGAGVGSSAAKESDGLLRCCFVDVLQGCWESEKAEGVVYNGICLQKASERGTEYHVACRQQEGTTKVTR